MKILVLSPKPPWPPYDGGAVATMRCIEGLAAGGASISVLAMKTEKHVHGSGLSSQPPAYLQYYDTVAVDTRIRPLKMLANLLLSTEPYDLQRFRVREYSETLHSLLMQEHFDIIQCEGLLFSYYIDEIRSVTDTPIVFRAHNVEHRIREMMAELATVPVEKDYLKSLARRLRKREVFAIKQFDAIIPISEPDFQWFKSIAPDKPMILSETGADIPEHGDDHDNSGLRVGFIGALNWQPNLDGLRWFLAGVWPRVLRSLPGATLHIAGRGAPANAKDWMAGKNVFLEGQVEDARRFVGSMTVMIAPLFAGSGLRIKIIEAMSMGKTVIATPVAAEGLPVEDHRELLIGTDAVSFCNALTSALSDPGLRAALGAKARELVRNRFDNLKQTSLLLAFYKKLCDGS
jgi:glycosyltransferase involved in cell wall biosynthesis